MNCPAAGKETGSDTCTDCKQGYYAEEGVQECKACDAVLTEGVQAWDTHGVGSTNVSDCSVGETSYLLLALC